MLHVGQAPEAAAAKPAAPGARRIAITSVFGDPRHPRTWSGAPNNVAGALERCGFEVVGLHAGISRARKLLFAGQHLLSGYGRITSTENIIRGPGPRRYRGAEIERQAAARNLAAILHTGTLDLFAGSMTDGVSHYLYCDQTWDLSLRYRPDASSYSDTARRRFDALERDAYAKLKHIFTFGEYVRDNLIRHYGVAADRVTAVGSGMGGIQPYRGAKDYGNGRVLFVAKHLFAAKGGFLLLEAFRIARERRPDLTLVIVGDEKHRALAGQQPNVEFHSYLPWEELERLFQGAALLAQPMLNDPWGQVYLEAMISRTPVLGLARNGLPEIVEDGRHGFLVDRAEPAALAQALVQAMSDTGRLAAMGESGQRRVLDAYSWDRVGRRIAERLSS